MEKNRWVVSKLDAEGKSYLSFGGYWEKQQRDALLFNICQAQTVVNVLEGLDTSTEYDYQEVIV